MSTDLPNEDTNVYFHWRRKAGTALHLRFKAPLPKSLTVLVVTREKTLTSSTWRKVYIHHRRRINHENQWHQKHSWTQSVRWPSVCRHVSVALLGDERPPARYTCVFNMHAKEVKRGLYFDSYGQHPEHYPEVAHVLADALSEVTWNDHWLQGLKMTTCGDYCVLTLLLWSRGHPLSWIIDEFLANTDSESRDNAVRATVVELYGKTQSTHFARVAKDFRVRTNFMLQRPRAR